MPKDIKTWEERLEGMKKGFADPRAALSPQDLNDEYDRALEDVKPLIKELVEELSTQGRLERELNKMAEGFIMLRIIGGEWQCSERLGYDSCFEGKEGYGKTPLEAVLALSEALKKQKE